MARSPHEEERISEYRALYRIFLHADGFLGSRKRGAATKEFRRRKLADLSAAVENYQATYERPRLAAEEAAASESVEAAKGGGL